MGGNRTVLEIASRMAFARKILLHTPISDERLLDDFVEQCLKDGVEIVAVFGPGCARIEDLIDWIVVGDGSDDGRFLLTSSHPRDSLEDVMNMLGVEMTSHASVQEVRL